MGRDKWIGKTRWIEGKADAYDVDRAIVEDGRITFDAKDDAYEYVIKLEPTHGDRSEWEGSWTGKKATGGKGLIRVRRYGSPDGGVALLGTWRDGANEVDWITELRPDGEQL